MSARPSNQWLESIEVTKSALQQKMLDIESEKVNKLPVLYTRFWFCYASKLS